MINRTKKYLSVFLTLILILGYCFFPTPSQASVINPWNIVTKFTDALLKRSSDIFLYLVRQKEYIFDDYQDPNIYLPSNLDIPDNLKQILPADKSASTTDERMSGRLVSVSTSTLPETKEILPPNIPSFVSKIVPAIPILFVEPDIKKDEDQDVDSGRMTDNKILFYTNQEREKLNLGLLKTNKILDTIADLRATDLFENQYFDHKSPAGKSAPDLAKNLHYEYRLIGENLALGDFGGDWGIVSAWMESPGHRENILNEKYKELGIAIKEGKYNGEQTMIAVQIFAEPRASCPKPKEETKDLINNITVSVQEMQADALLLYNSLNALRSNPEIDLSYYQQKVQEYNYFVKKINSATSVVREMIETYNQEVIKYNNCLNS